MHAGEADVIAQAGPTAQSVDLNETPPGRAELKYNSSGEAIVQSQQISDTSTDDSTPKYKDGKKTKCCAKPRSIAPSPAPEAHATSPAPSKAKLAAKVEEKANSKGKSKGLPVHTVVCSQQVRQLELQEQQQPQACQADPPSLESHLLLPREHVLDIQLSDHLPQIFICGTMTRRVRVLTWNIMTQCRHARFCNNGFGKNETGEEYTRRLQAIAIEVARFFAQDDAGLPMVATLQECPLKEDLRAFIDGIKQNFQGIEWRVMPTTRSFANVTLWDRSQWQFQQTFRRDDLRALITKLAPVRGIISGAAYSPCTFVNIHLEWKANPEDEAYCKHVAHVAEAARPYLVEHGLVVVAGDFNMNVGHTRDTLVHHCEDVVVDQIHESSQVWRDGNPFPNTVDGVIWSEIGNKSLGSKPSASRVIPGVLCSKLAPAVH